MKRDILPLPERARVVMSILRRAAENGDECPGNALIATAIGSNSPSGGSNIIAFLEANGMISVERSRTARVVTICATGQKTRGNIAARANYRKAHCARERGQVRGWRESLDGILMEAIANGLDFEHAAHLTGRGADVCAARFDELCRKMGAQAA